MDWPLRKRMFLTELMSNYRHQQREYQQAAQNFDGGDHAQQAHAGGHVPQPGNLPDDVNPADVPTPDGMENPYASAGGSGSGGGDQIDGERITRREPDEAEQQQAQPTPQMDMRKVHPAVRKHGNVVQVRDSDPDDADADAEQDA